MKLFKSTTYRTGANKTIASIVIVAFMFHTITWAQGGSAVWQPVRPDIKSRGKTVYQGIEIPYDTGTAHESFSSGGDELILNIQDAHTSLSAQESIVNMLEKFVTEYDLDLIALEGAEGPIDISLLKSFPDAAIREETARYLMRKGKMSAGEFFSIISEKPVKVYGVEDNELYQANMEAFNTVMDRSVETMRHVDGLIQILKAFEEKIYSEDLRELNEKTLLHEEKKLGFAEYWNYIEKVSEKNNIEIARFSNLVKLQKSMELEKGINFQKANNERKSLIDVISKRFAKQNLEELVMKSLSFKTGKISQSAYHQYILRCAEETRIDPKPYGNLISFTAYITLYEDIELLALFREVEKIENYIRDKMYRNEEEKDLYYFTTAVRIIRKVLTITATNDDYDLTVRHKQYFERERLNDFIRQNCAKYKVSIQKVYDLDLIFSHMDEAINFYNIARNRNDAMIQNVVTTMRQTGERVAALITGGFHTKGLSRFMREKGISYLVIMPKFDEGKERPYIAVLTNKKQPYERLLASGQYTLAVRAYFYTGEERYIREAIFYAIGRSCDKGIEQKDVLTQWLDRFTREYYAFLKPGSFREQWGKRPITPKQLARLFGLNISQLKRDENGRVVSLDITEAPAIKGKTGFIVDSVRVGNERIIVIRHEESGQVKIEVALVKNKKGEYDLDNIPPEAKSILKKRGLRRAIGVQKRHILRLEQHELVRLKTSKQARKGIIKFVAKHINGREYSQDEQIEYFIGKARAKGYVVSIDDIDDALKKTILDEIAIAVKPEQPETICKTGHKDGEQQVTSDSTVKQTSEKSRESPEDGKGPAHDTQQRKTTGREKVPGFKRGMRLWIFLLVCTGIMAGSLVHPISIGAVPQGEMYTLKDSSQDIPETIELAGKIPLPSEEQLKELKRITDLPNQVGYFLSDKPGHQGLPLFSAEGKVHVYCYDNFNNPRHVYVTSIDKNDTIVIDGEREYLWTVYELLETEKDRYGKLKIIKKRKKRRVIKPIIEDHTVINEGEVFTHISVVEIEDKDGTQRYYEYVKNVHKKASPQHKRAVSKAVIKGGKSRLIAELDPEKVTIENGSVVMPDGEEEATVVMYGYDKEGILQYVHNIKTNRCYVASYDRLREETGHLAREIEGFEIDKETGAVIKEGKTVVQYGYNNEDTLQYVYNLVTGRYYAAPYDAWYKETGHILGEIEGCEIDEETREVIKEGTMVRRFGYDNPKNPTIRYTMEKDGRVYVSPYDAITKKGGKSCLEFENVTISNAGTASEAGAVISRNIVVKEEISGRSAQRIYTWHRDFPEFVLIYDMDDDERKTIVEVRTGVAFDDNMFSVIDVGDEVTCDDLLGNAVSALLGLQGKPVRNIDKDDFFILHLWYGKLNVFAHRDIFDRLCLAEEARNVHSILNKELKLTDSEKVDVLMRFMFDQATKVDAGEYTFEEALKVLRKADADMVEKYVTGEKSTGLRIKMETIIQGILVVISSLALIVAAWLRKLQRPLRLLRKAEKRVQETRQKTKQQPGKPGSVQSIAIGVVGITPERAVRESRKTGVLLIPLSPTNTREKNLGILQEKAKKYGYYNLGMVDIVDDALTEEELLAARLYMVYEYVKELETNDLKKFLSDPSTMELTDDTVTYLTQRLDEIASRFTIIRSRRLTELSLYEYQMDRVAEKYRIRVEASEVLPDRLMKIKKPMFISLKVRNAAELHSAINEYTREKTGYQGKDYPRLHLRLASEFQDRLKKRYNVTEDNFIESNLLEPVGGNAAVERLGVVISWNDARTFGDLCGNIDPEGALSPEDIAIGDIGEKDLRVRKDENIQGILYVRMEMGLISQQYKVILELIASRNKKPLIQNEEVELNGGLDPGTGIFHFILKSIEPEKIQKLLETMKRYEEVLMAA